jgi:hypothetical protein
MEPPVKQSHFQKSIVLIRQTSTRLAQSALRLARWFVPRALKKSRAGALAVWHSRRLRAVLRPATSLVRIAAVAAAVAAMSITGLRATTQTIVPTEIGVVQNDWDDDAGILPEDLAPSKRFIIPGARTLHRVDGRIHFVRFGMKSEGNDEEDLQLRTPDGLEVRAGVAVAYRVVSGEAHRLVEDGLRSSYRTLARATAERVLLDELGSLRRLDWSDVARRKSVESRALDSLRTELAPFHLEPLGVHISSTWFPPGYEVEVMEQKLLEQRILTNAMLARRDERNHELLTERESVEAAESARAAELDFEIEQERTRLKEEITAVKAETLEYEFERKTAASNAYEKSLTEGRTALDQAAALRERLTNEALESDGGRIMIARQAAENLKFKTVKLDANNPAVPSVLDLDALIQLLVGQ